MHALFDADIDLAPIRERKVAIFGYGNQGRPQALNLRDSAVTSLAIAARAGGASWDRAKADGFDVMTPTAAAAWADVLILLIPDEQQGALYEEAIAPFIRPGAALGFAHGLAIRFELIRPDPALDVFLVSPKGPGTALRSLYESGKGMISLYAVHQDASGKAEALALAYAGAIGSGRAGILKTSFAEECEADLFNEQAVVWGAVPEILNAGFETLVEAGFSPEVAYLECVGELQLIAALIAERGIAGMRDAISNTAEFGAMSGGSRIVNADTRTEMRRILRDVRSGAFAKDLIADAEAGYPRLQASRDQAARQPIEAARRQLEADGGETA